MKLWFLEINQAKNNDKIKQTEIFHLSLEQQIN